MMKQNEKQALRQRIYEFCVFFLWISAITAFSMQYIVEMSPLLKAYNWLLGIGAVLLVFEGNLEIPSEKQNIKISRSLKVIGWVIGLTGVVICIVYYDYVDEEMIRFGSR